MSQQFAACLLAVAVSRSIQAALEFYNSRHSFPYFGVEHLGFSHD